MFKTILYKHNQEPLNKDYSIEKLSIKFNLSTVYKITIFATKVI